MRNVASARRSKQKQAASAAPSQDAPAVANAAAAAAPGNVERARGTAVAMMMAEAGRIFSSSLDLDATVRHIGDVVIGWFADWCVVDLATRDGHFERAEVAAADANDAATARALLAYPLDAERPSLIFDAIRSRAPVLVSPVTDEHLAAVAQSPEHLTLLRSIRPTTYMAVPLVARDRLVGVLLALRKTGEFTKAELHTAAEIAALAAAAVDNARTYQDAAAAVQAREDALAIVAHDLRSPIASIVFAAGLLQLRLSEAGVSGVDNVIDGILRTANYMTRLVDDLLDVSQLQSGGQSLALRPVPAAKLIEDVTLGMRGAAGEAGIQLTADVAADVGNVIADAARIRQLFSNLIGNALKFTDRGGEVRVTAERRGDDVHFTVADSGRGIAPDALERIFEPFWRSDELPNRGLGLGLAIARSIVQMHGSRIGVRSEPNVGSEFYFALRAGATPV
jgi:signal transduction histidine kinase